MSGATQGADGARKRWKHGKTVVNGNVRFTSVSALEKADSSSSTGCLRRWWYHYIGGLKEEMSKAQERGDALHAELAQYFRTGIKNLSSLAMTGFHMLPPPGPDLLVEHDMVPDLPDGSSGLQYAKLRAGGIPLVGAIDLVHAREENYGVQDINEMRDPYGTLKVVDWKTTSNLNNAKTSQDLPNLLQMAGYAKWAFEVWPELQLVRLNHGYFPAKGSARLVTALVDRDRVQKTWNRADAIAGSIRDAAKESNPDKVDANTRACRAYNRDCPAIGVCKAAMHDSLSEYVGSTTAERILGTFSPQPNFDMTAPISPNSLVAHLQAQRSQQQQQNPAPQPFAFGQPQSAQPFVQQPAPQQPTVALQPAAAITPVVQAPPQIAPEVQAEMQRLAAQEAQAAAQNPTLKEALEEAERIGAPYDVGWPMFTGEAARVVAAARGWVLEGNGICPGKGTLSQYNIHDPNQLPQVIAEIKKIAANKKAELEAAAAHAQAQMTAQMTQSQSMPFSAPVANIAPQSIETQTAPTATMTITPPSVLPPDAPASNPALATKGPETEAAPAEKKKRGRKPKAETAAAASTETTTPAPVTPGPGATVETVQSAPVEQPTAPAPVQTPAPVQAPDPAPVQPPVQTAPTVGEICFYVDCQPEGVQTHSFWPLINHIVRQLAQEDGVADIRDSKGRWDFGKWKGGLAAGIRAAYSAGAIPPGHYILDNGHSDFGQVAVDVMRDLIATGGGRFIRR